MTATTGATASPGMHPVAAATSSPTCTLADSLRPAAPPGVAAEVLAQLALVVDAAACGGLSGMGSEAALRVVEAVETLKSWADSVSVAATGVMCAGLESDFVELGVRNPTGWRWLGRRRCPRARSGPGWRVFHRPCKGCGLNVVQASA